MKRVKLAALETLTCGFVGVRRQFLGGIEYKLTDKEWKSIEKKKDHHGRPYFVDLDAELPVEEIPKSTE